MTPDLSINLEVQRLEDLGLRHNARVLRASGRAWAASPLKLAAPVLVAGSARVPAMTASELDAGPTGPGWSADFRVPETVADAAERWAIETVPVPLSETLRPARPGHDEQPILGARRPAATAGGHRVAEPGTERGAFAPGGARARPPAGRPTPVARLRDSSSWAALLPEPVMARPGERAAAGERSSARATAAYAAAALPFSPTAGGFAALVDVPQTVIRLERRVTELAEFAAHRHAADARRVAEAEARADAAELRVKDATRAAAAAVEAQAVAESALRTQAAGHARWIAEQDERANAHADALRRLDIALAERDEARARVDALLGVAAPASPLRLVADDPPSAAEVSPASPSPDTTRPPSRLVDADPRGVWGEPLGFPQVRTRHDRTPSAPEPPESGPRWTTAPPSDALGEPETGAGRGGADIPAGPPDAKAAPVPEDHTDPHADLIAADADEASAPAEQSVRDAPPAHPASSGGDLHRPTRRRVGVGVGVGLLAGAGVLLTADAIVTAVWQEPLSAAYTARKQASLRQEERELTATFGRDAPQAPPGQSATARLAQLAVRLRSEIEPGEAIGRLTIPRLDDAWVVVEGSAPRQLRSGPGHASDSALPGRPATTAVAGHATTFGAPFRQLAELRPGDEIEMQMPYGTFTYRVEDSQTMDPEAASRLATGVGEPRLVLTASGSGDDRVRVVSARQIKATPDEPTA